MALIEQVYNLDLVPNGRPLVVNVSQYDQGSRALTFNFFKDNVAFTPPAGYSANITGTKPDGTGFMYAMTVSGSAATVEVTQQMCAVAGDCPCEIRLIDGNSNVLGTANFTLSVEKAAMDDDTVISESDIPYFEDLATQAAASAASAAASAAIFPTGGTAGQVLTKTATGTAWDDVDALPTGGTAGQVLTKQSSTDGDAAWEDPQGGDPMVVNITYANGTYSADKTYAEIMANINAGGQPVAKYGDNILQVVRYSSSQVVFGELPQSTGIGRFYISNANTVTYILSTISPTNYYATTLGSASATSDSTVYSGGYKLTVSNTTITANSTAVVFFPNGDYSGNVTWITSTGKVDLYFDQNPNGYAIRVEWKTLNYSSATIS